MDKIISQNFDLPESNTYAVYEKTGGYSGLRKAFTIGPKEVQEEVKASGLRGRGGAGFPCGVKWGFVPADTGKPIYLCVNADEGEPGTFKDREILLRDPHRLIEGIVISSYALNVHKAFVYFRGEFVAERECFDRAVEEAISKNLLGKNILGKGYDLEIVSHMGAGAYICGEETALLNSLEGYRGLPRIKPPFPAIEGLFGCPTIINNVETLANVATIIDKGAKYFRSFGTEKSPGMNCLP